METYFSLQLSITDRCNLTCRHCYRAEEIADAPVERWFPVLQQFASFAKKQGRTGIVSFTGGEPLLVPEVGVLVRLTRVLGMHARMATNGTLLTLELAQELKQWGLQLLQVSLDGPDVSTHEAIRGEGAFQAAIEGLHNAQKAGLSVNARVTLIPGVNLDRIPDFFELANREGIPFLTFSRVIPIGSGDAFEALAPEEQLAWMEQVATLSQASPFSKADLHEPTCDRCFLEDRPYRCGIGESYLSIDADGTVYPCRRLPQSIGNIFEQSFAEIWRHPFLEAMRARRFGEPCGSCPILEECRGGCRAAAFATGDPFAADPACWYGAT